MENPIQEIFDSRDLIEYKKYLEELLTDYWNSYIEEHNEVCLDEGEEEYPKTEDFDDVDLNLEGFRNRFKHDILEYEAIKDFCEELSQSADFEYGEAIIREDYFPEYAEDFCKEVGYLSKDLPFFISNNIDWNGVADYLQQDYFSVEYEGNEYYIRH